MDIPHLSADRHGLFPCFGIMNNIAMNTTINIFMWPYAFISPRYIPKSRDTSRVIW
jgi:hypothetical protein